METLVEKLLIYSLVILFCLAVVVLYIRKQRRNSRIVEEKINKAKQDGLYEPVSLHPVVDPGKCIRTGACIAACPEKDILGIRQGKATTIHASQCIGHGACFHACPTEAISLCIGTEKRGVELPHVDQTFETNVPGIFIAGELGGMGLIRNAVEQGRQAVENIAKKAGKEHLAEFDLAVVGAGPAGISATLTAKKNRLRCVTLEQDTLGGTVFTFPRSKIVMTSPMELPLYGKVKLRETTKSELLDLWQEVLKRNGISIRENAKAESVVSQNGHFQITTRQGDQVTARYVLLAIGRRGSPRKLGVPGETLEKVAYRLLEPEAISGEDILIVGGGDSAIESALLLSGLNRVTLSYRGESFSRLKPRNMELVIQAGESGRINIRFSTQVAEITNDSVMIQSTSGAGEVMDLKNDKVFIFAGGELPTQFLEKIGITITRKFGEAVLKHN